MTYRPLGAVSGTERNEAGAHSPSAFPDASWMIDRLRRNNLALERLLNGLDGDLPTSAERSHATENSFGRD